MMLMIVYSINQFNVYNQGKEYIIHNTDYQFKLAHTHIRQLRVCKQIIKNVIKNKIPKTRNTYLLRSHIRISDKKDYIEQLERIIDKHKRKQKYFNVNKGV